MVAKTAFGVLGVFLILYALFGLFHGANVFSMMGISICGIGLGLVTR